MYTLKLLACNAKIDEQIYLSTAGKGLRGLDFVGNITLCSNLNPVTSVPS